MNYCLLFSNIVFCYAAIRISINFSITKSLCAILITAKTRHVNKKYQRLCSDLAFNIHLKINSLCVIQSWNQSLNVKLQISTLLRYNCKNSHFNHMYLCVYVCKDYRDLFLRKRTYLQMLCINVAAHRNYKIFRFIENEIEHFFLINENRIFCHNTRNRTDHSINI